MKMKRVSKNYVCTLIPTNIDDIKELAAIKKQISEYNKTALQKKRVFVRGRKPIVKEHGYSYKYKGHIVGGIKNASMIDVYIYNR